MSHRRVRTATAGTLALSLTLGVGIGMGLLAATLHWQGKPYAIGVIAAAATLFVTERLFRPLTRLRPTERGGAVAARWREHCADTSGRSAAATAAAREGGPLPDGQVWSAASGTWRQVSVGPVVNHLRDPRRHEPEHLSGEVVKRWSVARKRRSSKSATPYLRFCCVDDGVSPMGRSFRIEESAYRLIKVGSPVTVDLRSRFPFGAPATLTVQSQADGFLSPLT